MAARRYNRPPAEIPEHIQNPDYNDLLDQMLTVEGSLGDAYRRFYNYSTSNLAFLLMQGCPIEPIATYEGWKRVGRQVTQKGAYYIRRPILVKTGDVDEETGEEKKIQRYKPVKSIFPVSMTEGEPLPDLELPEWSRSRALAALAITEVAFEQMDGNLQGYSYERNIAVNPAAANGDKTWFHEGGHILLGHTARDAHEDYNRHRGMKELGAEAVAHIVMNELGLLTPEKASVSRAYIQTWSQGQKPSKSEVADIFKAADQMLAAGRPVREEIEV
ncbi:hypothetical protein MPC38_06720 [Prescottella equi]|uniref:hypothetical protein n=1 Tax=Rhodococcus hoagii TaxID=43767 RepID=UPI001F5B1B95|nr:hypothetical protein [Prescottella equi]UNQ40938.1 hypothetical protein MPC38_06720 [Prescottella equi]